MEKLHGKNILITGATGGIGKHTAKLLHQSGAQLFLTARDTSKLTTLADELGIDHAHTFAADLSKADEVNQLREHFFTAFPSVDILINAAGVGIIKNMDDLTEDDFMRSIQSNLLAPFLLMKQFLPSMKETKKGLIINIPGVLGKTPMAGAAAYTASKYGLNGMMKSIREELKRTDIRITNIFLGGTDTPFWDTIDLRVQRDKFVTAEEAAKSIWFLCQQPTSGVVSEMVIQPFNHQAI